MSSEIADRLSEIVANIDVIEAYCEGHDRSSFVADRKTADAVALRLIVIGESVAHLNARVPALLATEPSIPWRDIRAMRNRIAHAYSGTDFGRVFDTVTNALPELRQACRALAKRADDETRSPR